MDDKDNTLDGFDPAFPSMGPPRTSRKRARAPPESPPDPAKIQEKREKARERQRRKRERDRMRDSSGMSVMTFPQPGTPGPSQQGIPSQDQLSPEEAARRDKVRAAARERQRKHRAIVKQKKMAELGLAMGNDGIGGMEEMHYALGPDGQYQPVMPPPHELGHDQPFPQGHTGGQTFASTLLLSFSCSPLLKQHLLRTLHMTNEELASLEPILSAAWDQWDHARRVHYAEQAAKAGVEHNGPSEPHPYGHPNDGQQPNDFRARFHRPLTAPSPFRTVSADTQTQTQTPSSSASPSEHPNEAIDPSLSGAGGQRGDPVEEGIDSGSDIDAHGDGEDDLEKE